MGDTDRWTGTPPDVAGRPADGSIRPRPTRTHPRILNVRTEEADRDQVAVDDLSFTVERGEIFGVLGAGATGYLLKDAPREELIRAVRAAAVAEAYRRRLLT